jgi:hypothetical protein
MDIYFLMTDNNTDNNSDNNMDNNNNNGPWRIIQWIKVPLSFHDLEVFHLKSKLQQTPPEVLFPLAGARP